MFRKSGQDKIHHVNIKKGITSHFAKMLKILQKKHMQQSEGDEYVYSNDESNNLCNALEAVFLHGLKEPVKTKLSSYVGLNTPQDTPVSLNFWAVAEKFTHKNVIVHLKNLRQITTEIGLCRAWIRLALNDGLMESYLHSVVVDTKSLRYFYHSYSYLRDVEQPGILSNYLTGLMSLTFQLSLNSSVLNSWSNSTLQLVSHLNLGNTPPAPVIRPAPETAARVLSPSKSSHREFPERRQSAQSDSEPIVASKKSLSASSQDRMREQAMFNSIRDVEAIRRATTDSQDSQVSYTPSECSSTSQVSCPDPSGFPLSDHPPPHEALSPHLYPRPNDLPGQRTGLHEAGEVRNEGDRLAARSLSPYALTENLEDLATGLLLSPPRQRSRQVSEEDSLLVSPLGSISSPPSFTNPTRGDSKSNSLRLPAQADLGRQSRSPSPLKTRTNFTEDQHVRARLTPTDLQQGVQGNSLSMAPPQTEDDNTSEPCDDIYGPAWNSPSPTPQGETNQAEKSLDAMCADLPVVKLDPRQQDEILKKVLGEIDLQADRDREARDKTDSLKARNLANDLENQKELSTPESSTSPSMPMPVTAETKEEEENASEPQRTEEGVKGDSLDITLEEPSFEKSTDTIISGGDTQATSNQGLASEPDQLPKEQSSAVNIDTSKGRTVEGEDNEEDFGSGRIGNSLGNLMGWSSEIDPKQSVKERKETVKEDNSRPESFAAMLRSYLPGSSAPDPSITLDQVIEGLPDEEELDDDAEASHGGVERHRKPTIGSESSKASPAELKRSSRMVYLFRVPQEHGLSHQNFTCRGCSRPIGIIYGQPRKCSFDGGLYCYECHENMETYIPSSIIFDWDFRKKKVCRENHKFLTEVESQPLYDVGQLNPRLYSHVPELQDLKILRQRLCYLKSYLFTCSAKMAESLRQKIWPREHLYDHRDTYSITDLHQVQAGTLQRLIKDLVRFSSQHVYSCALCSQKGYVCEICRNARIIYAFEVDTTVRCERCKAVYHKTCMTDGLPCPKCERWGRRSNSSIVQNHPEDYGSSPVQVPEIPQPSSPPASVISA